MTTEEKQKINVWIPGSLWKQIGSYGYESPTKATIAAFEALVLKEETGSNPEVLGSSQEEFRKLQEEIGRYQEENRKLQESLRTAPDPLELAELRGTYAGIKGLIEEKDRSIERLEREVYRLDEEVRRLDMFAHYFKSLEFKQLPGSIEEVKPAQKKPAAGKEETVQQIEKICKNCNQPFYTGNVRQETCSGKCRSEFSKKKKNEKRGF